MYGAYERTFGSENSDESRCQRQDAPRESGDVVTNDEVFRSMMSTAVHHERVKFRHVLADSWFSSSENMEFVKKKLKKDFVMPIKSNRLVAIDDGASRSKLIYKRVDALPWTPELSVRVRLKDVELPLLLTRVVFTHKDGTQAEMYLVTSDLSLSGESMVKLYKKRWSIEECHKSLKKNVALEKAPKQKTNTQTNHFFASLYGYLKLEKLKLAMGPASFRDEKTLVREGRPRSHCNP